MNATSRRATILCLSLFFLLSTLASAAPKVGKLQIHFMDVGQGDGALLVSPMGETVLFDTGVRNDCDRPLSYLQQLGITNIDYLIVSHYHDDHLGCAVAILQEYPLQKFSFDRGGTYKSRTFTNYVTFVGAKRKAAIEDAAVVLDGQSANPVKITFVALNGNGVPTTDENDRSVVCVVRYGKFDAVLGGDLSGMDSSKYRDVETSVAPKVGQVEVYKVNHHGSQYSSNTNWLGVIRPLVGIISCGDGNDYHHPARQAVERLHQFNVATYWTEKGNGVSPRPDDKVGGNIIVEVAPNTSNFTVRYGWTNVDQYAVWTPVTSGTPGGTSVHQYAWSKTSKTYHYENCRYVRNIDPLNLVKGDEAPEGKSLHAGCPK